MAIKIAKKTPKSSGKGKLSKPVKKVTGKKALPRAQKSNIKQKVPLSKIKF